MHFQQFWMRPISILIRRIGGRNIWFRPEDFSCEKSSLIGNVLQGPKGTLAGVVDIKIEDEIENIEKSKRRLSLSLSLFCPPLLSQAHLPESGKSPSRLFVVMSVYKATQARHLAVLLYHEHTNTHTRKREGDLLSDRCWLQIHFYVCKYFAIHCIRICYYYGSRAG